MTGKLPDTGGCDTRMVKPKFGGSAVSLIKDDDSFRLQGYFSDDRLFATVIPP